MTFNPSDHVIIMERKSKQKDAQGHEAWKITKTEYLPVQWRLYWFRLENQKGKIDSKAFTIDLEKGAAIFETYVEREDGGSARMHGSETQGDWRDYIEKAQTKSLGRALAAVGYGSQFTDDEFAEGERIVDSPVDRGNSSQDGQSNGNHRHVVEAGNTPKALPQGKPDPLQSALEKHRDRALFLGAISSDEEFVPWLAKQGITEVKTGADLAKVNTAIVAIERQKAGATNGK